MNIGLTSGFAFKEIYPISEGAFHLCFDVSSDAIEINFIGGLEEMDAFDFIDHTFLARFDFVTIHAPCCNTRYGRNKNTKEIFTRIERICKRTKVHAVVFHPDLVDDFEVFNEATFPVAFENMDMRKKFAQCVEDLKEVFEKVPRAGFVLDVNHCYSIDKTMELAKELLQEFGGRLCEVHASGFLYDYHGLIHQPGVDQDIILDAIPETDVPIIIESLCGKKEEALELMTREYEYICGFLERKFG